MLPVPGSRMDSSPSESDSDSGDEYIPSESTSTKESSGSSDEESTFGSRSSRPGPENCSRAQGGPSNAGPRRSVRQACPEQEEWVHLSGTEEFTEWIRPFNELTGYRGGEDLTTKTPLDIFSMFIGDDFWNLVTEGTNAYALQKLSTRDLGPRSRFRRWSPVSVSEMKAFFALHMSMGIVQKCEIEDYWSKFWVTQTPGFGQVMSRDRFTMILSFLHFADNDDIGREEPDRLFKIRPLIDLVIPRFAALWAPHKELALDEMTIAFKGRSALKMYNPKKPDKYGYRVYALSESCSGYVLQWIMHTGKDPDVTEMSTTEIAVRELVNPYVEKGHIVYMDSYFNSPRIAKLFSEVDTGVCGTVSFRRKGMPEALKPSNLTIERGDEAVFYRNDKLMVCAWVDTKRVTMLSTVHGNACVWRNIRSKAADSGVRAVYRPGCIDDYNRHMGGVDRSDQRMKYYLFPHRSRKWYHRIINAIFSIAVVNSHIIYTKGTHGKHKSLKAYIQEIITQLLAFHSAGEKSRPGRPSAAEHPLRLSERHWLYKVTSRPDCVVCSDRSRPGGRHQTRYRCRQCGVALCVVPCHERYHTVQDYKRRTITE